MTADRNSHPPHAQWDQIDALLQPWRVNDIPGIAETFSEDGVLHSVMGTPIRGRANIRKVLGKHLAFHDAKVCEWREYFDQAQAAPALDASKVTCV